MSTTLPLQTNEWKPGFISMQLSYSTADVERNIFFAGVNEPINTSEPVGDITFLVVNGEPFTVIEDYPKRSIPFSLESGLFRLIEPD